MTFKTIEFKPNLIFYFFPTALEKRQRNPTHKARVMQATQANTQPKLALHMLSAIAHKKAITVYCSYLEN